MQLLPFMCLYIAHKAYRLNGICIIMLFAFLGSGLSQTALASAETDLNISSKLGFAYNKQGKLAEAGVFFKNSERTLFQLDALYVDAKSHKFDGLGAHYYFHETENTVYGLSAAYVSGDLVNSRMLALESIYFPKRFKHLTFGTKLGYASIEYATPMPFVDTDLKKAFGMIYCEYLHRDRWLFNVAYENRFSLNTVRLKTEYLSSIDNLSFFCELQKSSNDYEHALAGLRYHFGNKGTINRSEDSESTWSMRKRRGHFSNSVYETFFGIGVYGALYNKNGNRYAKENGLDIDFKNYGVESTIIGGDEEIESTTP